MTANFLFVSDDKYVKNLGICTYSLMHNTCPNVESVKMYVMDCGITDESKEKLIRQAKRFDNAEIIFFNIEELLDVVTPKVESKWNRAIYGRLLLDKLLEKYEGIDRMIYLDSDLIVNQPITELFEMDLQGKCIAGVADGDELERKRDLHISEESIYINSGVLVIDTKRWLELDVGKRAIEYINSFPKELLYPDQDAINYILCNDILTLPLEYNFFWMICDRDVASMFDYLVLRFTQEEVHYALHHPKIVHFAGHDMWSMYGNTPIPIRVFKKYKKLSDWNKCRRKFHSAWEIVIWLGVVTKRILYRD